jgi:GMP synthase-like glutamine amidotransferase
MNDTKVKVLTLGHVGRGTGEHEPFDQLYPGSLLTNSKGIHEGDDIDALVIWGGEDISPSLYNDTVAGMCYALDRPSQRDVLEWSACKAAVDRGIPIIGVCRGAQLVCALAGGRLIQHVDGHGGTHMMDTYDGQTIPTSSVHHQMMYPFDVEHELIAWSSEKRSKRYIIGTNESDPQMIDKVEPEIVWFPKIKALGIQGHPEFHRNPKTDPFVQYCMGLVQKYMGA